MNSWKQKTLDFESWRLTTALIRKETELLAWKRRRRSLVSYRYTLIKLLRSFFFEKDETEKSKTVNAEEPGCCFFWSSWQREKDDGERTTQPASERASKRGKKTEKKRNETTARVGGVVVAVALARLPGAGCCSTGDGTACGTPTTTWWVSEAHVRRSRFCRFCESCIERSWPNDAENLHYHLRQLHSSSTTTSVIFFKRKFCL